ncbi:type II secretion system GspH family protein [Patescibacteria group bacterium]|nr:type II secretion system GspH family protein [Patescibacteria group bacterium]MBU0777096.1 type II secretion system GspH family protein [Patescibacteria group bacterium]MBU0845790.1 type II secretion system GspH family protein [Patescibacteria group bacterium]MBU0922817.1 type II secretion system GspH family protein [Patescibacteria group bacterium]MBU1066450.1 type II secretion system GspH family protein [Patescibacteria group bacterium]
MNKKITVKGAQGFSLLEILVVITVFSILAILTTQAVLLTLRGSKKSESLTKVRGNVDYSLAIIERNIRNAESIIDCSDTETDIISYLDENGVATSFSCGTDEDGGYIASASGRLTNSEVDVAGCSFVCEDAVGETNPAVIISISAHDANLSAMEGGEVTISTKIFLRTY